MRRWIACFLVVCLCVAMLTGCGDTEEPAQEVGGGETPSIPLQAAVQTGVQSKGTMITLTNTAGTIIVSYEAESDFQVVIISAPGMNKGETYTITVGPLSGSFEAM